MPMKPITIAVDAMGGDHAPEAVVQGAVLAVNDHPARLLLVGDEDRLGSLLAKETYPAEMIEIVPASQVISMEESPRQAIEEKPESSIMVAAKLVAQNRAEALVSAGSTGSVVLSAAKNIPRIHGVRRTAIATVYPTLNELKREDHLSLLLDVGANVRCDAEELVQFAIMGAAYVSDVRGIPEPTVALLNIGEEATKGGEQMQEAYKMLKETPHLNFIGNIEGKDLLRGIVDVVVTEGFVGNVVIKTLEGAAQTVRHLGRMAFKARVVWKLGLIMLRKGLALLKEVTDYSEYGGAPLLGFEKLVIIAHGRSSPKAIANAIKLAGKGVRDDLCGQIARNIREFEIQPTREYDRLTHEI
jgi:glycerol-3-phosphate acyltransferase PlsX